MRGLNFGADAPMHCHMGLLDWFRGRKTPDLEEVLAARGPTTLPPRRPSNPRPPSIEAEAVLMPMSFAGLAAEQLAHELHDVASAVTDPGDRMFVSTLIRAVKNEGVDLPTAPDDVVQIQRLLSSPDCDVPDLARAIKRDPAMSARFVSIANSPLYARGERVTCVEDAVVRVGLNQASSLVMAIVSKAKMFRVANDQGEADRLHRHALATAVAAKMIAKGAEVDRHAFIGGLLHDLGRVFMLSTAGAQFQKSRGQSRPQPQTLDRLVTQLHAGFSALVAERWGYEAELVLALQHHHRPIEGGASAVVLVPAAAEPLTYTLAGADLVAHVVLDEPLDDARMKALEEILEHLEAGPSDEVIADCQDAFEALMYELDNG